MSRRKRVHRPGGYYHVTLRGNHRQDIFRDSADRSTLDAIVRRASERTGARVLAYCWMTNHVHLVVQVDSQPLDRLMQPVGSRYARYLQRGNGTTGHLFERRYHAVLVTNEQQLLHVVRYVHFNPVRAGLVAAPGDYVWSSHRQYLGQIVRSWVDPEPVLSNLARDVVQARRVFAEFCGEALKSPTCMATARNALRSRADPGQRVTAQESGPLRTLNDVIAEVCRRSGVSEELLAAPGKGHILSALRGEIAGRASSEGLASITEVARRFNRDVSSLARAASRWRQMRSGGSCQMPNPAPL